MATIIMLSEFFMLSLALGLTFFSFLANTRETGAGFMRVVSGLCAASASIGLFIHLVNGHYFDASSFLYYLSIFVSILVYFFHKDKKSIFMWLLYFINIGSLSYLLYLFNDQNVVNFLFTFSSLMFLGSITYAMVMGHWYLVTPKLSEKPLIYAMYFMWGFMLLKLCWTIYGAFQNGEFFSSFTREGAGYAFNWLMLTMRIGWGYIVLGIMSYFSYRLIAMRSIQSATGMLYAMTFFVFVSELISAYMFFQYGLPI